MRHRNGLSLSLIHISDVAQLLFVFLQRLPVFYGIGQILFCFLQRCGSIPGALFQRGQTPVSYTHLDVYKRQLLGRAVDGLMLEQFPHIVDVDFSAQMEKNLDKVESGKADWRKTVDDFYQGFEASLEQAEKNMEGKKVKVPDEPSSEVCDLCGRPMVIKVGKYGKFLACSGFPECRGTKRLVKDTGGICPKCGKGRLLERKSSKGRIYYGCECYPDCDFMTWDMPVSYTHLDVYKRQLPTLRWPMSTPGSCAASRCAFCMWRSPVRRISSSSPCP